MTRLQLTMRRIRHANLGRPIKSVKPAQPAQPAVRSGESKQPVKLVQPGES